MELSKLLLFALVPALLFLGCEQKQKAKTEATPALVTQEPALAASASPSQTPVPSATAQGNVKFFSLKDWLGKASLVAVPAAQPVRTPPPGAVEVRTLLYDYLDASQNAGDDFLRFNNVTWNVRSGSILDDGGYAIPGAGWKVGNLGAYDAKQEDTYFAGAHSYYDGRNRTYVAAAAQITQVINFTPAIPAIMGNESINFSELGYRPTQNHGVIIAFLGGEYTITKFTNGSSSSEPKLILSGKNVSGYFRLKSGQRMELGNGKQLKLVSINPTGQNGPLFWAYFEVRELDERLDYFSMSKETTNYTRNGVFLDVLYVFNGGGDTSYVDVFVDSYHPIAENKKLISGDNLELGYSIKSLSR